MIAIKEIMDRNFHKLSFLDSVESAVKAMEKMKSNYLLIEEKGEIKGVVTSHELAGYPSSRLILDCAIKPIAAISEETLLDGVLKVLKEKKVDFFVVINKQGAPIGATNKEIIISFLYQELKKSNIEKEEYITELKKAEESLKEFSRGLEEKVKERTFALSVLYEISNALAYTLDYQQLMKLIMESLFKIVDYDICASLLFDANTANITLKPVYAGSARFVDEVKNGLLNSTSLLTGETMRKKRVSAFLIPLDPNIKLKDNRQFDELHSFFNVPFVVRQETIGMINVSSCRDNAFSEDDIKLIYTIANQASNAIERLQAVITAEKSKMESMVESMAEGVVMVDERGEVMVANPRVRQLLDLGFEEQLPAKIWEEKAEAIGLAEDLKKCEEENCLVSKDLVVSIQGEPASLHCDITSVRNEKGEIIGILTILRDITERKRMLEELKKTQEQQLQLKDQFLSHVSHELRSPLTAVYEFVTILLDGLAGDLSTQQRKYLEIALRNTEQLKTMIHNLLEITRAQTGKMSVEPKNISLDKVISELTDTLRMNAENKHIMLSADIPKGLPNVYVDPDRVQQIITNLVGNAIKFTHENGSITVRSQVFKKDPKFLCVSVTDTGCGISPEESEKVFEYLYQTKTTNEVSRKGLGLGLYICKELVSRHGGRIWVKSQLGKGSTFFFTLPIFSLLSLLEPIFTPQNLKKGSVALVNIGVYPIEKRQLTKIDERVLLETWDVLKGCVLPVSDVVLPRIGRTKSGETFFIVACADQKGAEVMECRIKTQLARCDELRDADLYPNVSFTVMDISSIMKNTRLEQIVKDISTRIEKLVKKMIHKERNL